MNYMADNNEILTKPKKMTKEEYEEGTRTKKLREKRRKKWITPAGIGGKWR